MAAASVMIGRAKGVHRAALATIFPTPGNSTVVLDTGANTEVKPDHLAQFGVMGSVVAEVYVGLDKPRVGLLNIGEEEAKGRSLEKAAFAMLENAPINFVGNVEGRELATGKADVIVTDGFTGNVLLKTAEGAAFWVVGLAMQALSEVEPAHVEAVLPALRQVRHLVNYESTGGAHLVGLKGVAVIAHGSSSSTAIVNALALARTGAELDLVGRVATRLAAR
jgi:glycerol-3-phosphate acyltransferase PlsX